MSKKDLRILKEQLEDLNIGIEALQQRRDELVKKERELTVIPKLNAAVGKFFKCKNDYGMHTDEGKEWYLYRKIIKAVHRDTRSHFNCLDFQIDDRGTHTFSYNDYCYTSILNEDDWIEIQEKEYDTAFENFINKINDLKRGEK